VEQPLASYAMEYKYRYRTPLAMAAAAAAVLTGRIHVHVAYRQVQAPVPVTIRTRYCTDRVRTLVLGAMDGRTDGRTRQCELRVSRSSLRPGKEEVA
jgi:hypothetical protein